MSAEEGAALLKKLAEQNEAQKREDEAAIAAHHAAAAAEATAKASELPGEKATPSRAQAGAQKQATKNSPAAS